MLLTRRVYERAARDGPRRSPVRAALRGILTGSAAASRARCSSAGAASTRRSDESLNAVLATSDQDHPPIGQSKIRDAFSRIFLRLMWERPQVRKRWALRHRTEESVRDLTEELGWTVAVNLDKILLLHDIGVTVRHAILDELAYGQDLHDKNAKHSKRPRLATFYGITTPVARVLDWFIRLDPDRAGFVIGEIVGDAERRMDIPRDVTAASLRTALSLDGEIEEDKRWDYLDRVLPPRKD